MSDNITKRVGLGTAYGFAKAGGYEGTVAEFTELLGNIAIDLARIENLSVTVTTLPAGSQATASLNGSVLSLGIPKGDKGDKGNTGETGAPAGFGTVSATVDDNIGTPSVEVTASGADTAKNFDFAFHNLKGQKGDKGDTGDVTLSQLEDFTVVQTDENIEPYSFRSTPKCGHIERLKKVVGASVAFNQKVAPNAIPSLTSAGITGVNNGDGSYTLNGTATGVYDAYAVFAVQANHKYFVSGCPNSGSADTYYVYSMGSKETGNGMMVATTSGGSTSIDINVRSGVTVNNLKFYPQVVDLTLALGSTIADYVYSLERATAGSGVAWLKQHFPKMFGQYNAYDAGSIRSVEGVSAHITKDADENVLGSYPLDSDLALRGMLKISNGNLYADGDEYLPSGQVNRLWGERAYQSGDVTSDTMITDGTTTVYKLSTPTTETADPFTENQICEAGGTEEFVSTSIVPIGHETEYPLTLSDIRPTANGNYVLKCTVSNGKASYEWVSA